LLAGDADVGEQSIVQLEEIPQLPSPPAARRCSP
jgi:hypothetical protein